ncbi:hypothetical protein BCR39DRAFT_544109 [Naematelia encephala]|uniref:Inhibitor I9 domain-containing protein n=1 Tax=Naematelia encephala TaxID=71784 RepID=A0A1Y2ASK7_9TREE|nr:hypothetical protein BCR39DRAFT_544109 [Naematelia encephala]
MADKKVIMQFKKSASAEDKARIVDSLKAKGAQIHNDDNINSRIMPFISLTLPVDHYEGLKAECVDGSHSVVENLEEDQEMRIQA